MSLEEEARSKRKPADRMADAIANFVGSIPFVIMHLIWFGVWVPINMGLLLGGWKFDPYPFALLCMLVSLEGVLLSTFAYQAEPHELASGSASALRSPGKSALRKRNHEDSADSAG